MTADERYAKCTDVQELMRMYRVDELGADTFEYLNACYKAFEKHYQRLINKSYEKQVNY